MTRKELYRFFALGGIGVEVGVHCGRNAADLLEVAKPRELHFVDAWFPDWDVVDGIDPPTNGEIIYQRCRERFGSDNRIVWHRGLSIDELPKFPDGFFDWVYLDSSHDYGTVWAELEICKRIVKPDGILSGHDYCCENYGFGVREAVDKFVAETDWQLRYVTSESDYPSWLLTRVLSPKFSLALGRNEKFTIGASSLPRG